MIKVLLATNLPELDEFIAKEKDIKLVSKPIYYREEIVSIAAETKPDVAVITSWLDGSIEMIDLIYELCAMDVRVIFIAGNMPKEDATVATLVSYGTYDILFGEIEVQQIIEKIYNPTPKSEGIALIKNKTNLIEETKQLDNKDKNQPSNRPWQSFISKIKTPDTLPAKETSNENNSTAEQLQKQTTIPARPRTGTPHVILAMGKELNRSFQAMFSNLIEIVAEVSTAEEFKKTVTDYRPDIAVIMRTGPAGGVPEADALAEWAASHIPEILFIAGELDETGSSMVERAQNAGISHILSCPPGGYISGEELVYLMQNIVRKLQEAEADIKDTENRVKVKQNPVDGLQTLKRNATKLGKILKPVSAPKNKSKKKIKSAKINMKEGLSLDEKPAEEQIKQNIVKTPTTIVPGGLFAVVTPWRPGLAGRIAAQAVKMFAERGEVAYIAATGQSTGAIWLDVPEEELIMSDWRVPGSQAPVKKNNISIYAVDPAKNLNITADNDLWDLVKTVRKDVTYTVLDFGSDINAAHKAAFLGWTVVLVIVPGGDPVETKTSLLWLKTLREGKQNIVPGIDLRGSPPAVPEGLEPKVIIRNNPADALSMALRSNEKDEFIWNR